MEYLTKGNPQQGLWGATLGFFIGFAAVSLFGPTAIKFKEVMELSPLMIALLVAMPSLSGSLLRIPFSAWVDIKGGKKPFIILLILSIIGMIGLSLIINIYYPHNLTPSFYPILLLLGLLSGCGIATFSVGISQVSYWFDQAHEGKELGIYAGLGNLAPGIFSLLLPVTLASLGLGGSYLLWLLFLSAGTIIYFFMGKDAWYFQLLKQGCPAKEAKQIAIKKGQTLFPASNLKSIITDLKLSGNIWKTWVLVAIYFTTFGGFIALTAWLPTFWSSFYKVTIITAGLLTALYSILASLLRVVGGIISDKLGGMNTIFLSLTIMIVGAVIMTFSRNFGISVFAEVLLAIGMGFGNASVFKLVPQEIPKAIGGAAGWVGGLGAFGGFIIPPSMAVFVKAFGEIGYALGFIIFVILSILSLILTIILKHFKSVKKASKIK